MELIKHDSSGFLQGERIEPSKVMQLWGGVQSDIAAIRKAIEGGGMRPPVPFKPVSSTTPRASLPVAKPAPPSTGETATAVAAAVMAHRAMRPVISKERDKGGRFKSKNSDPTKNDEPSDGGERTESGAGIGARVGRVAQGVGEAENVEPAIKAFKEVAQPMVLGYEALFGGDKQEKSDKKHERWYRRIWQVVVGTKKEDEKNNKQTQKGIKALIEKPVNEAGKGGGLVSAVVAGVGALLSATLGKFLPKALMGGAMAGGLGTGVGVGKTPAGTPKTVAGAPKAGGKLAGLKGALKRVPLLGSALTVLGGAGAIFGSETSDMSRAEKDRATGSAVGGTAGTLGGMAAGAKLGAMVGALGGPIGVAIGSVVGGAAGAFFGDKAGQVLGDTVGGWVTSLREADIPGKFSAAVDTITATFGQTMSALSAGWDAGISYLKDLGKGASEWASKKIDSANAAVRDATGIDVKAGAQIAVQAAKETAARAGEAVKEAATVAVKTAKETAVAVGDAAKNSTVGKGVTAVATAAKNAWKASDRKNALLAEMDAQGITDKNERAMMLAQMDHETGGFTKGEESFNYRSADRIMEVSKTARNKGKPAIEAAMKQGPEAVAELMYGGRMGNVDPGDGYKFRGRGHVQITGKNNYEALGKKLGLDLVNNPDLLSDPAVAAKASVQWWKDNGVGATARAGDVKGATQVINNGQNGFDHRKALFASYLDSPAVTAAASVPAAQSAVAMPAPQAAAPAPKIPVAVATAGGGRGFVNPSLPEPGQDIGDRRIAHIATGGYST